MAMRIAPESRTESPSNLGDGAPSMTGASEIAAFAAVARPKANDADKMIVSIVMRAPS